MALLDTIRTIFNRKVDDDDGFIRQGKFAVGQNLKEIGTKLAPVIAEKAWQPFASAQRATQRAETMPRVQLPRFESKTPVGGFVKNLPVSVAESYANIPRNVAVTGSRLGNLVGDILHGQQKGKGRETFTRAVAGVAPLAESVLDVYTPGALKGLAKQTGKQAVTQALKTGVKQGAIEGFFGGAAYELGQKPREIDVGQALKTGGFGAILGGILGGTISAGSAAYGQFTKKLAGNVKKLKPELSTEQAEKEAKRYIQLESGRMAGRRPNFKDTNDVKFVGDLRESIGLSRTGDEIPQLGQSIRKLTPEESLAKGQTPEVKGMGIPDVKYGSEVNNRLKNALEVYKKTGDRDAAKTDFFSSLEDDGIYYADNARKFTSRIDAAIDKYFPSTPEVKPIGIKIKAPVNLDNTQLQQPAISTKTLASQIGQPTTPASLSQPNITQNKLAESINRVKQETDANIGSAEIAKQTREVFSPEAIKDINKLKQMSRSRAFLEGDIETLRKKGDTVNKVIEAVQKVRPDIADEAEALDFALNFPTKAETKVTRPVLTPEEKQIRFQRLKDEANWKKEFGTIVKEVKMAEADKSLFKDTGAVLTPNQYSNLQTKKIRIQSEASKKAIREADNYFKEISIPAYKQGRVNLGDQLPADELLKTSKDKIALAYQRETIQRNIEDIFGNNSKMKKFVVDNMTNNENSSVKFQNDLRTKLGATFKKLGIKKGSKLDYASADYIEGNISLDQLKKLYPDKWQNVVKASDQGRVVYKDLLGKINEQLTRFGYDPIPERQNYVTHTTQLQTFADKIGNLFNLNSDELPRTMAGINMDTKPGRKFFGFGLQRKGGSTHEGLITALDKYIPSASRQIYHTEDIQRGRAILDLLQKSASEGDTRLSGFTSYFSQYVDHLAGKQNVMDRPIEKIFGRKFLEVGDWLRKRTGANMVGGNVSSAVTNFIPFTQSLATTDKPSVIKGIIEASTNFGKDPSTIDGVQSGFLLRRFAKEKITGTLGENIKDVAGLLFNMVDKFTSTSIVSGKYFEGIKKGLSKDGAMAYADNYAQRVLADRSFGQSPLLFNSKTLGALTQFQLEVNNQLSFLLKDIPKNFGYSKAQIASSLMQFAVFSYVFNNIYEKITGRRPQIDIIQAGLSTAHGLQQGDGLQAFNPIDSYDNSISDKTGTGQILNQLPFSSMLSGGRIPIKSAIEKPQYYILPPLAGGQIKKTYEGLKAYNQGESTTPSGRTRFEIEKTPTNLIKSATFGQWSLPGAKEYINKLQGIKPTISSTTTKTSDLKATDTIKLPDNIDDLSTIYKDDKGVIEGYQEKKIKILYDQDLTQGEKDEKLGELQGKVDGAIKRIKIVENDKPEAVFKIGLNTYQSGGGMSVEDRTVWVAEQLANADDQQKETMIQQLLDTKVLTKSVAEALNEMGVKVTKYTEGGKIKTFGGKGKKAKKVTIKKVSVPTVKVSSKKSNIPSAPKIAPPPTIKLSKRTLKLPSPSTSKAQTIKIAPLPKMKVAKGGFLT